jgi:hypothetical protein
MILFANITNLEKQNFGLADLCLVIAATRRVLAFDPPVLLVQFEQWPRLS